MFDYENSTTEEKAVEVLNVIYSNIEFTDMKSTRLMKIWDEFKSKVVSCVNTTNNFDIFVDKMCKKFEISNLDYANTVIRVSQDTEELKRDILKEYRNNLTIIMLYLRLKREEIREGYSNENK
jgi:hypothetical protein